MTGTVLELSDQDGQSVSIKTDSATVFVKSTRAGFADLKAGNRITIMGEATSGTMTARMIQIAAIVP